MQFTKKNVGSSLIVKIERKIDTISAPELGMEINDSIDDITKLVLDFGGVTYISSIGLRVLLELHKKMKEQGVMELTNVTEDVMKIFKMTGFNNILTIV